MKHNKHQPFFRSAPPTGTEPPKSDPKKPDVVDADFEVVDDDKKKE